MYLLGTTFSGGLIYIWCCSYVAAGGSMWESKQTTVCVSIMEEHVSQSNSEAH